MQDCKDGSGLQYFTTEKSREQSFRSGRILIFLFVISSYICLRSTLLAIFSPYFGNKVSLKQSPGHVF